MIKPIVALVGRPNVGKSTIFNRIAGKRIAIVDDQPGVTRDRIYADCDWAGYNFTLIDTGGIAPAKEDNMSKHIRLQAEIAINTASVIIFVVDGKSGLVANDFEVVNLLRHSKKPVVLAVNKLDNMETTHLYDFYELGIGNPIPISAEHAKGIGDVLDEVVSYFGDKSEYEEENDVFKIAVVGKPNAGKSSLVNKLLGYNRSIVSEIAGTTRDAIDTPFKYNNKDYLIIDTAGIRKKSSIELESVEKYSIVRSLDAVRRADVVLIVVDSKEGLTEQDIKIIGFVHNEGKPSVIVMNKWDLVEKDTFTINQFEEKLKNDISFMDYYKSIYLSAKTGKRVDKVIETAEYVYGNATKRITTGILNDVLQDAVSVNEPPSKSGKRLKIFYATQGSIKPPTFVLFVNDVRLMHFSYQRYLENSLRKAFDFTGTPIKIILKSKSEEN